MKLNRAQVQDAERIWKMQIAAFSELYAKYEDTETSPATEPLEKVILRLEQPYTYYYFIEVDDTTVGAIRVVDRKDDSIAKRISPIFIMKEYRGQAMRRERYNWPKWFTVTQIGNWIPLCKRKPIATYMRKWGIVRLVSLK